MLAGRPPFIDPVPSVVMVKQATEAPPPLPRLRQDIPRALSLTVHTLLAKRSEDRPQTAATARKLLERSLVRVEPVEVSIEPLPSFVAAASGSGGLMLRYGAPLFLVSILGALLLALAYGGPAAETASKSNALNDLANRSTAAITSSNVPATNANSSPTTAGAKPRPASLTLDQAKSIVAARTDELMSDLVVAQTARGAAILGIQEAAGSKLTGFFMMERRGPGFHVTARGLLDSTTFRARRWMVEKVSAKDDGRNQVLFSAINSNRNPMLKLVLFDPDKRQAFSLSLETDSRSGQTRRMQWSDNTADSRVAAYRVLLRDKARTIIGRGLKGI
jgi:hypothetical protein